MSRGRHAQRQRERARQFQLLIEAAVPSEGLARLMPAMCSWCNERHGPEGWTNLHRSERGPEPKDWVVFAFATPEDAAAFRRAWADKVSLE